MYVEIFLDHMYVTERNPDNFGDVTWQWDEMCIVFADWTYQPLTFADHLGITGTACLDCVIT